MKEIFRLGSDVMWLASGQIISVFAMIGMYKVWAVYLSPEQLGRMALIISTASILVGIGMGPLFQAMLASYGRYLRYGSARQYRAVSGAVARTRALKIATLIGICGIPTTWYFGLHWGTPLVIIGLFTVDTIRMFEQRLFAAARRQRGAAFIAAGDILFRLLFVWLFLHVSEPTAYAAILGNLAGAYLFLAIMRLTLRFEAYPGASDVPASLRLTMSEEISTLAKPLLPSLLLVNLTELGSRYFIGATLGLTAAGLFVAGQGLVKRPYSMLNYVLEMTMAPVLTAELSKGDLDKIRRTRRHWLFLITVFSALGVVLFYILGELLISALLSNSYAAVSELLIGFAIADALFNIANVFNWFCIALRDGRAVLLNSVVGAGAVTVLTVVLCAISGLSGGVWALIVGYALQLMSSIWTFERARKRVLNVQS